MTRISTVSTRNVVVMQPNETLQQAALLMSEMNVGALPVSDGDTVVGIITDRDITVRATALNLDASTTPVSDIMTQRTLSCSEDDSVEEVLEQMGTAQVRRLPVLDRDKKVVGIVSLGDLAVRLGADTDAALRDISAPSAYNNAVV
jgi:CBS domain-containing protein